LCAENGNRSSLLFWVKPRTTRSFQCSLSLLHIHYTDKLYIHVTVHRNRFLLNNQPDALIIQIYCHKTLHVSGIFSAHHQEFSTVLSALVSFMQFYDDRFQAESGWNCKSGWLFKRNYTDELRQLCCMQLLCTTLCSVMLGQ
jgi:hypothetical protein